MTHIKDMELAGEWQQASKIDPKIHFSTEIPTVIIQHHRL